MTAAKATEYQIIQQLLQRSRENNSPPVSLVAERLIAILAATAGIFLLGTYLQELLWVVIAMATIGVLGYSEE